MSIQHRQPAPEHFQIEYDPDDHVIVGRFLGRMDYNTLLPYALATNVAVATHACKRIITDLSNAVIAFADFEAATICDYLHAAGMDRSWKRAIVCPLNRPLLNTYADLAQQRGFNIRVFPSHPHARAWIREPE